MVFGEILGDLTIYNYVEVEYEENDEELELMKKVMGFNHFDTTKVYMSRINKMGEKFMILFSLS